MFQSTQQFIAKLEEAKVKYQYRSSEHSGKDVIAILYGGDNISNIQLQFFFDPDGEDVAVRVFDLVKAAIVSKKSAMLETVNAMNNQFRFAKFCYDLNDDTVQMEMDATFREHDVGEICFELLIRGVGICDEAYPEFMKALWA